MPVCELCKKYFLQLTESHMKTKHNLTIKDYKHLYPNINVFEPERLKVFIENQKLRYKAGTKEGFKKHHKINKGKDPWNKGLTKETDERIKNHSNKLQGRILSKEHKRKLSEIRKEKIKKGLIIPNKGEKNGMYGKKLTEEHKMKLLNAAKRIHCSGINKVELKALKTIKDFGFVYTGDSKFWLTFKDGTRKNPDFIDLDNKCAFEVFGDYWHKGEDPQELIYKYNEIGWNCIVMWEHDVHKNFRQFMNEEYDIIIGKDLPDNNYSYLLKGI